jgi:hypothetical protein
MDGDSNGYPSRSCRTSLLETSLPQEEHARSCLEQSLPLSQDELWRVEYETDKLDLGKFLKYAREIRVLEARSRALCC